MPDNTAGKRSSGSRFSPPPASIWNSMIDAGRAFADNQLSGKPPQLTPPRDTDIIKIRNDSGELRRRGEILKIEGNALEDVVAEHIWLLGVEPTTDCYFGILKEAVDDEIVGTVHVSGCCVALVDVVDVEHTRAIVVEEEYVLRSSHTGPIEILYKPEEIGEAEEETGEAECVVRFFCGHRKYGVVLDADLAAAGDSMRSPTSGLATVLEWSTTDDEYTESELQITVWNHSESTGHGIDTFGVAEWIDGHYWFFGDCDAMANREGA